MGQLEDIPAIVKANFGKISDYYKGLSGFFGDPETPGKDASEVITGIDLSGLRRAIQSRVKGSGSTTNASLLAAYRDLDSMQAELALRNMTRIEYYREAASESAIRNANWQSNLQDNMFNLTGVRQGGS